MSTAEPFIAEVCQEPSAGPATAWTRLDSVLERGGEWLNPILVKECRQAIKSKLFGITFTLLLAFAWFISLVLVAAMGTGLGYNSHSGPMFFIWYYGFLAFALVVIVPFSAYRSLAIEREDNTFDLVAISTLPPRQIVGGKLGSAMMQMMVYFSALSPCLAFTYLMRGIDIPTIGTLLFYLFMASMALSLVALFMATISREKHWQIVLSVIIIVILFLAFIFGMSMVGELLNYHPINFGDNVFWIANGAFFTAYGSYFLLLYLASCAQLTFPTDNRATKLRYAMLLQQALYTGWMGYGWYVTEVRDQEIIALYLLFLGIHWALMGMLMTGETGQLSARVRRDLPQSFLGRAVFSWFNPGPATGYVFAVVNLTGAVVVALVTAALYQSHGGVRPSWRAGTYDPLGYTLQFATVLLSYVVIYVGIGNLLVTAIRRVFPIGIFLTLILNLVLLLIGAATPNIIRGMLFGLRDEYTLLQITDPVTTLYEAGRDRIVTSAFLAPYILPFFALVVFAANLPLVLRELRQTRVAKPMRVVEEDAAIAAVVAPHEPADPWENPATTS